MLTKGVVSSEWRTEPCLWRQSAVVRGKINKKNSFGEKSPRFIFIPYNYSKVMGVSPRSILVCSEAYLRGPVVSLLSEFNLCCLTITKNGLSPFLYRFKTL